MQARLPRLPNLPARLLAAGVLHWGLFLSGGAIAVVAGGDEPGPRGPAASIYSRGAVRSQPAAEADAAAEAAQAERIVASSLARIAQADAVSIKLRQRVRLGDRVLVGTGRYLQAGQGEEQRFRFETTLTCDTDTFEITEVSDGLFCWLHRRYGQDPPMLHRIDIQRVRGRLEELGAADPADTAAYLGGLQRCLWWARQWFRFRQAVPAEIEGKAVWIVDGYWPPGTLALLLPELAEADKRPAGILPEELPDGVPCSVRLAVGQSDLLPQRLEFLGIPGTRPVSPGPPEVIAAVEFLETQLNGPIDATAFYYQPASEELIDLTRHIIKSMSLMRP